MGQPHGSFGDGKGAVTLSSTAPMVCQDVSAAGGVDNGPRSHQGRVGILTHGGERAVTGEFPIASADTSGSRDCTRTMAAGYEVDSFRSSCSVANGSQQVRVMRFDEECPQRHHRQSVVDQGGDRTRDVAWLVSDPGGEAAGDAHVGVIPTMTNVGVLPGERGRATEDADSVPLTPLQRNALEGWLKEVAQETETAATALQVRAWDTGVGAITSPLLSLP